MRILNKNSSARVGILVYGNTTYDDIVRYYKDPLQLQDIVVFLADVHPKSKVQEIRKECETLFEILPQTKVDTLIVCIGSVFKLLTKSAFTSELGIKKECVNSEAPGIALFGSFSPNAFVVDPNVPEKAKVVIEAITAHLKGSTIERDIHGKCINIFDTGYDSLLFLEAMSTLLSEPVIAVDIETFSLRFYEAGLGTISFGYGYPNGHSFTIAIDSSPYLGNPFKKYVKSVLKQFFIDYKGKLVFHNAGFDVTVLIYELFMNGLGDVKGMYEGIDAICRDYEDTYVIAYTATNNTYQNELGLKKLALPYTGNYAEDVSDITKIPLADLMHYNATDVLATLYVFDVYGSKMDADNQREVYETLLKPSVTYCIQMQLLGLPIDLTEVKKVQKELIELQETYRKTIQECQYMQKTISLLQKQEADARNSKLKVKRVEPKDIGIVFNPSSNKQVAVLLYDVAKLPILDITPSGSPATGAPILSRLSKRTDLSQEQIDLVNALYDYSKVNKIITSFIPAFLNAPRDFRGNHWLYGFFHVGGTVSGRLSSSSINLQQLPATGSPYAKPIKKCFKAPEGWLFVGLDFNSLEDYISALTTRDTNKLKIYIDGYDGHCFRAYAYYKDQMPDITEELSKATSTEEEVSIINSIGKRYPKLRQRSKAPTFA